MRFTSLFLPREIVVSEMICTPEKGDAVVIVGCPLGELNGRTGKVQRLSKDISYLLRKIDRIENQRLHQENGARFHSVKRGDLTNTPRPNVGLRTARTARHRYASAATHFWLNGNNPKVKGATDDKTKCILPILILSTVKSNTLLISRIFTTRAICYKLVPVI